MRRAWWFEPPASDPRRSSFRQPFSAESQQRRESSAATLALRRHRRGQAMRILLVEDHPQLAESVAQAMRAAGWTVDVLHDGVAADLALASEDYALAILDVGLPRLDGFQVRADRNSTRVHS